MEDFSETADKDLKQNQLSAAAMTGKLLNERWGVNASHALYHHEGRWYHRLTRFPGGLFDRYGYILFESEQDFLKCPSLAITQDVHVPGGISSIPGYRRVLPEEGALDVDTTRSLG